MNNELAPEIRRIIRMTAKQAHARGYASGRAEGLSAGRAEALSILPNLSLATTANGERVTHFLSHAVNDGDDQYGKSGPLTRSEHNLLHYVMTALAEKAKYDGSDPDEALHHLSQLAANPEKFRTVVSSSADLSWVGVTSARGGYKAVWYGPEQRKPLYGERARRAVQNQAARANRNQSIDRASQIYRKATDPTETISPEEYRELATHLPSLPVEKLRAARVMLGASFKNAKRRDDMAAALVQYALGQADQEGLVTESGYVDPHDTKSYDPTLSVADRTEKMAREHTGHFIDQYLQKEGRFDKDGNLVGVTLNTDEFRDLFRDYRGTNASEVHEASSHVNKAAYKHVLPLLRGKGNNRFMVLAGGGGSGKGTAVGDFFEQKEYPIVLDQVSDNFKKLVDKLDDAKANGFEPQFVFVDRPPQEALGGIIGRAMNLRKDGKIARTVPLDMAYEANLNARKVALQLLEQRPDIQADIIDNRAGKDGLRRLIEDPKEAAAYLREQIAHDERELSSGGKERIVQSVIDQHKAGKIDRDIAEGLVGKEKLEQGLTSSDENTNIRMEGGTDDPERIPGPGEISGDNSKGVAPGETADDRRDQPAGFGGDEKAGATDVGDAESGLRGTAGEKAVPGLTDYVDQAMANLKKTSRTAGGVVDVSASKEKAGKIVDGLTGDQAATAATNNFRTAVESVYKAAKDDSLTRHTAVNDFSDKLNQQINAGITKAGVLLRTDDSPKYPYTLVEHLPLARKQFAEEFAARLRDPNADPVETAAWVEWRVNLTDHAYADGVGKTSKALAMIPLMRAGLKLPNYPDNKEFFKHASRNRYDPNNGPDSYLDDAYDKFVDYYRSLMPKESLGRAEEQGKEIPTGTKVTWTPNHERHGDPVTGHVVDTIKSQGGDTGHLVMDSRGISHRLWDSRGKFQRHANEGDANDTGTSGLLEETGSPLAGAGVGANGMGDSSGESPEGVVSGPGAGTDGSGSSGGLLRGNGVIGEGSVRGDGGEGSGPGYGPGDGDGTTVFQPAGGGTADGQPGDGEAAIRGRDGSSIRITAPTAEETQLTKPATAETPTDTQATSNFHYTSRDFAYGGLKQKYAWNIEALKTLQQIEAEGRETATPAEQEILSKFIGWGQFGQLFDYAEYGHAKTGDKWEEERNELRAILGEQGYQEARESTKNSHYTDPSIVDANWQIAQKLGFKGGRMLETSAGIGYYLGMMPEELRNKTRVTAVEKDSGPGKMLSLLYPNADVRIGGIEEQRMAKDYYDFVSSNVPFGDYGVHDPDHNHMKAEIHDYFFLKSLDHVRPGGIIQHITSLGTMDKLDPGVRKKLAESCDLVSAIRFPADAHKGGAGTSVATDMIILRKRKPGEAPSGHDWTETTSIPDPLGGDPITVNKYFVDHPEQVLGQIDRSGKMYTGEMKSVSRAENYEQKLKEAIDRIPANVMSSTAMPPERLSRKAMPKPGEVKPGSFHIVDGKAYKHGVDGNNVAVEIDPADMPRLQGHIEIRDAVRDAINAQLAGQNGDATRKKLNDVYDAFVAKHGRLRTRKNMALFADDPEATRLLALEKYNASTGEITKGDAFAKDVVRPWTNVTKADTTKDAYAVSIHETGGIDIKRMASMTGFPEDKIVKELYDHDLAFHDPQDGWKPSDQYLSGNVRKKLVEAQAAAKNDPKYKKNVERLLQVQPKDIPFLEITANMGAHWIPASDYARFAADMLGGKPEHFLIERGPGGKWHVSYTASGNRIFRHSKQANEIWGTYRSEDATRKGRGEYRYEGDHGVHFMELLSAAMGSGIINVKKTVTDANGNAVEVMDKESTEAAMEKLQEMKEKFGDWLWTDKDRRDRLHRYYNDNHNNTVKMKYDGQHLEFPGMNPAFYQKMHPHIKDFVWQVITNGRGIAGHEVGMGKTAAMIASAMELRRLGLSRKPAIACLKANIETITEEAHHLYPGARILSTAGLYDKDKRQEVLARLALGDYDLVVLTHDHLDKMKMAPKTQREFLQQEIKELVEAKMRAIAASDNPNKDPNVKRMEKAIENLEKKIKDALDDSDKDDNIRFEETGIDQLFVDEAHYYKTLPCYTEMGSIKGVNSDRSDRATEMHMRTRWLLKQNNNRGVVFATGTPITNTMGELYNLQRYIQPEKLAEAGIKTFDDWARMFGQVQTKTEFTVSGEHKPVTRFSKFVNMPEMKQLAMQDLDVRRVDDDPRVAKTLLRPKKKTVPVVAKPTARFLEYMEEIKARAKELAGKRGGETKDNMLLICTDGRKASIDMRLVDDSAEDDPGSKVNLMVKNVLDLHKQRPDQVQLIFSDMGVNPVQNGFHLYGDIIDKLVKGGIPREKIANFGELEGTAKTEAMEKLRKGEMLVAIGGTKRLGTGVNVQDRIMAMHHLDVPDRPDSLEQRNGRGYRHGNMNYYSGHPVMIHNYVTEKSLDQTFWTRISTKDKFIKQALDAKDMTTREMEEEDTEELSPDYFIAASSGDPRLIKRYDLEREVGQLDRAKRRHDLEVHSAKQSLESSKTEAIKHRKIAEQAEAFVASAADKFSLTVDGTTYADKKEEREAGELAFKQALAKATRLVNQSYNREPRQVATWRGLDVMVEKKWVPDANGFQTFTFLEDSKGNRMPFTGATFASMNKALQDARNQIAHSKKIADNAESEVKSLEANQSKEFPKQAIYEKKKKELDELLADLMKKKPESKSESVEESNEFVPAGDDEGNEPETGEAVDQAYEHYQKLIADPDIGLENVRGHYQPLNDLTPEQVKQLAKKLGYDHGRMSGKKSRETLIRHLEAIKLSQAKGEWIEHDGLSRKQAEAAGKIPKASQSTEAMMDQEGVKEEKKPTAIHNPAKASWTKLKSGSYGLRIEGKAKPGDTIIVHRKDGSKSKEKIGRVVWTGNGVTLAEHAGKADLSHFGLMPNGYDTILASGETIPAGAGYTAKVNGRWVIYTESQARARVADAGADLSNADPDPEAWKSRRHVLDAACAVVKRLPK